MLFCRAELADAFLRGTLIGALVPLIAPPPKKLTVHRTLSFTRHGWFRLPPIDQYSSLLPPVGVWTVSQFQCSEPLDIVASVGRYPADWLMSREPILHRNLSTDSDAESRLMGA